MKQLARQTFRDSHVKVYHLLLHRFILPALATAAFSLMLLSKADVLLVEQLRNTTSDVVAPVLDVLSKVTANIARFIESINYLITIQTECARLHAANAQVLYWRTVADQLGTENETLRHLLKVVPGPTVSFIAARVIAVTEGPFIRSALLNAGSRDGVRKGQAVVAGEGLVGRVERVGRRSSSILLLTDLSSKVPVVIIPSHNRALLVSNKGKLQLIYKMGEGTIAPGDRVVTAEEAHVFPPDLPVGIVIRSDDSFTEVKPFVQLATTEYVRLIDYGLNGILPDSPEEQNMQ